MTDHTRKDKKPFVPPPWERDQFEELERRKAEREIDRLMDEVPPPGSAPPAPTEGAQGDEVTDETDPGGEVDSGTAEPRGPKPAEIETMLNGLKAQEPDSLQGLYAIGIGASAVLAVLGLVLSGWGISSLAKGLRSGPEGAFGGGIVLFLGVAFLVGAGLLAVRTLRQRGDN
jgi:hypothetical protein